MFYKEITVIVDGMYCEHCVNSVKKSLEKIENVKSVKVNLNDKKCTIKYKNNLDLDSIKALIEEMGYTYSGIKKE